LRLANAAQAQQSRRAAARLTALLGGLLRSTRRWLSAQAEERLRTMAPSAEEPDCHLRPRMIYLPRNMTARRRPNLSPLPPDSSSGAEGVSLEVHPAVILAPG
jgi:hypothetical protein